MPEETPQPIAPTSEPAVATPGPAATPQPAVPAATGSSMPAKSKWHVNIWFVLIVLILAAGVGGYVLYTQHQNNSLYSKLANGVDVATHHKKAAPKPVAAAATTDPYTGWKTYTSSYENASFKYPPTWTVTKSAAPDGGTSSDAVKLTSPSGFVVNWIAPLTGVGGGCDASTNPHVLVDQVITMPKISSKNPLYMTLLSYQGHKELAVVDLINSKVPVVGDTGQCLYYPAYSSASHLSAGSNSIQFDTSSTVSANNVVTGDTTDKLTDDQYLVQTDVQNAELIFKSLTY